MLPINLTFFLHLLYYPNSFYFLYNFIFIFHHTTVRRYLTVKHGWENIFHGVTIQQPSVECQEKFIVHDNNSLVHMAWKIFIFYFHQEKKIK